MAQFNQFQPIAINRLDTPTPLRVGSAVVGARRTVLTLRFSRFSPYSHSDVLPLSYLLVASGSWIVLPISLAADRMLGDAPTSKPNFIDWQSMSGRTYLILHCRSSGLAL